MVRYGVHKSPKKTGFCLKMVAFTARKWARNIQKCQTIHSGYFQTHPLTAKVHRLKRRFWLFFKTTGLRSKVNFGGSIYDPRWILGSIYCLQVKFGILLSNPAPFVASQPDHVYSGEAGRGPRMRLAGCCRRSIRAPYSFRMERGVRTMTSINM